MTDQAAFAQFDKIAGTTTPITPPQPGNSARAQEILNLGKTSQQPEQSQSSFGKGALDALTLGVGGSIDELTGGHVSSAINKTFPGLADLVQGGITQYVKNFNDPNSQQNINREQMMKPENLAVGFMGGGDIDIQTGIGGIKPGLKLGGLPGGTKSLPSGGLPGSMAGGIKTGVEDISNLPNTVKNILTPKSEAEILATTPKKVANLKPNEREIWFSNKQSQIDAGGASKIQKLNIQAEIDKANIDVNHGVAKQQIIEQATKDAQVTTKQAQDLTKKLGIASNENVVSLRPKAIQLLQKQGSTFTDLVDSAMAGKGDTKVSMGDLAKYIDGHTATPEEAVQLKQVLGAQNTPEQLPGQQPFKNETKTLQEVYDQTKSLRQNISTSGTKGTKVFTPADMNTQKAISMLTGFMQDNGVDFSEANQMWSKWAPVRDQLVQEGQIFNQAGTKSETLANTMAKVARGEDPGSIKFISTLEQHLGPINAENKAIIAEMDANEKIALTNSDWAKQAEADNNNLASQNKSTVTNRAKAGIENVNAATEKASEALKSQKIEVTRQAALKDTLRKIRSGLVTGGLGVAGYEGLKKTVAPFLP